MITNKSYNKTDSNDKTYFEKLDAQLPKVHLTPEHKAAGLRLIAGWLRNNPELVLHLYFRGLHVAYFTKHAAPGDILNEADMWLSVAGAGGGLDDN